MADPVTVSERDLRTLLGIVGDDRGDFPAAGLPLSLLAELRDQVRCDELSFFGLDSDRRAVWFEQNLPAGASDLGDAYEQAHWEHFWDFEPCTYPPAQRRPAQRDEDLRLLLGPAAP